MAEELKILPGILSGQTIKALGLVDPIGEECLKATSCDLRLGQEVFVCGQERSMSRNLEEGSDISIEPFGSIIFSTKEVIKLKEHKDIVGRFDLMIEFALEGLILQVGPQVEPGYEGPLFGLILNTQGVSRIVTKGRRFLSIEFSRVETAPDDHLLKSLQVDSLDQFLNHHGIRRERLAMPSVIQQLYGQLNQCKYEHGLMVGGRNRVRSRLGVDLKMVGLAVAITGAILSLCCSSIATIIALLNLLS